MMKKNRQISCTEFSVMCGGWNTPQGREHNSSPCQCGLGIATSFQRDCPSEFVSHREARKPEGSEGRVSIKRGTKSHFAV